MTLVEDGLVVCIGGGLARFGRAGLLNEVPGDDLGGTVCGVDGFLAEANFLMGELLRHVHTDILTTHFRSSLLLCAYLPAGFELGRIPLQLRYPS